MFSNSLKRVYIYMHILNGQLKSHSKGYGSLGVNSKLFCPYLTSKQMAVSPSLGFPGGSDGKASACKCGRPGFDPWVGQMPWRRKWQLTAVLLPGKFHGWKSLVGYSPGIAKSRTWLSSFTGSSSSLKASAMHRLFGHWLTWNQGRKPPARIQQNWGAGQKQTEPKWKLYFSRRELCIPMFTQYFVFTTSFVASLFIYPVYEQWT